MEALRHAHRLSRLVLAWFVLALGVAMAAPVLHQPRVELVCSSAGAGSLVVLAGEEPGTGAVHQHTQDCLQCWLAAAPPHPAGVFVLHAPAPAPVLPCDELVQAERPSPFAARGPPKA